ncbi:hypothetical protein [Yoonia sp. BS5-3]|uniref:PilZ domain-containing protein n=1 Tax=Yoonia phaeophyticola TaxID=3137369 RepID=A0ABZ2V2S4_9RHOB
MVRLTAIALISLLLGGSAQANTSPVDCWVIDRLDTLHSIQARLSRNVDNMRLQTDMHILRNAVYILEGRNILASVQTNAETPKGRTFQLFLNNSEHLLAVGNINDVNTIRGHFTPAVRSNLETVNRYLSQHRCLAADATAAQIAMAQNRDVDPHEDDGNAAEIIKAAAEQVFSFRNLIILVILSTLGIIGTKTFNMAIRRRKRRARRRVAAYTTQYRWGGNIATGLILDINCFGIKLKHGSADDIITATPVEILIEDGWVLGSVAWANNHYAGLQFKKRISLRSVNAVCNAVPIAIPQKISGAQTGAA